MKEKITIIGGGNMGRAFAHGLLQSRVVKPNNLIVANPSLNNIREFKRRGTVIMSDNRNAVRNADIIVIAVKPQTVPTLLREIGNSLPTDSLLISIAAGISLNGLQKLLPRKHSIVRVTPNLCAKIGQSMSVWVKGKRVSRRQTDATKQILLSIGEELEFKRENHIDIATAISGSGPAYLFYLAELMQSKSRTLGISENISRKLVNQTLFGSALMLKEDTQTASELRKSVTSKGGTTDAAFREFQKARLSHTVLQGIGKAVKRARQLNQKA